MKFIYLIKTLNLIALIFIPLNFVFAMLGYNNNTGLVYLWLCITGYLINYFRRKNSKFIYVPMAGIFLALIAAGSIEKLIYTAIYCIMVILVVLKANGTRYDTELDLFYKGIYLSLVTCIAALVIGKLSFFSSYSSYYLIIYLVSSILLLRNLRFMEYSRDSKEGKQINNRYSIMIVILSFILSISYVREFVVRLIKGSFIFLIDLFMYLFSWLFLGIGYVLAVISNFIRGLLEGIRFRGEEINIQITKIDLPKIDDREVLVIKLANNPIFKTAVKAFVILLVIYIIVSILRGLMSRVNQQEEYLEEKEFISRKEEPGQNPSKGFLDFLKPRNNNEQIRLYYQRYMINCIERDIKINETDTTEEINNKSQSMFDKNIIDGLRSIYIKIRYGERESTREMVKEMGRYYKNIKKQ